MDIRDAVMVVTGASSGIGEATAREASARGARLVLAARREQRIAALADELGDAIAIRCDVTDEEDVARLVSSAMEAFGRIDVLVDNAGQGLQARVEDTAVNDFRALLELNLVAPLSVMRAVIPRMREQGSGSIVNVSSGTTFADVPGTGAYVASKIGLERLSAIAREELAEAGIAVSVVIPFATGTEFIGSLRAGGAEAASDMADVDFDPPERVARVILGLVESGDARADLVPIAYGGTRE